MDSPLATLTLDRIRDLIAQPQWRNGGKLPAETELCQEMGVSRPVSASLVALRGEGDRFPARLRTISCAAQDSSRRVRAATEPGRYRQLLLLPRRIETAAASRQPASTTRLHR